ncbi:MAG: hypothetical protein AAFN18_20110 [Cyanobacteria bacterium J06554_6]
MNDSDMELQAIRQKLQTLKSEAAPAIAQSPWLPPRQSQSPSNLAQVTAAIESLKQHRPPIPSQATPPRSVQSSVGPDAEWIAQVQRQCEAQILRVNELGQQQGSALLGLKQWVDQLELEFERRGWDTPAEFDATVQFLVEQEGVAIPLIERTPRGQLNLGYHTVDFYQAEYEAMTTAQALRQSYGEYSRDEGDELGPYVGSGLMEIVQQTLQPVWDWVQLQFAQLTAAPARQTPFTLMDGLIWFSGAAIVRVLLDAAFQFYPALWTPLVMVLIGVVAIALYRALTQQRTSGLSYRLMVAVAGLIIGGQFM